MNRTSEIEGRDGESNNSAVGGAFNSVPGGVAGILAGPVTDEIAVEVGLETEFSEGVCIILWCTMC